MLSTAAATINWQYDNSELANPNLIDRLVLSICDSCGIDTPHFRLHLVISELVTNAIDHGVLGLQSGMKDSEFGLDNYYSERCRRLESVTDGWILISVEWCGVDMLRISVADSGDGYDYSNTSGSVVDESSVSGRGLMIVNGLCASVTRIRNGSCVVVDFEISTGIS